MPELNAGNTSNNYYEVDASNTSSPPNGAPTGTFPSQAEGIWRAIMGATQRFWDRANGSVTTTGSAGLYLYTPVNTSYPTAYVQGEQFSWKANFTSVGGDTLNVNGLGARPIVKAGGTGLTPIVAGDIQINQTVVTQYNSTYGGSGAIQIMSPIANIVTGPGSATLNDIPKFSDTTGKSLSDGYTPGAAGNLAATTAYIPQNSKSANYTTVLGDANEHIYHPSADTTARTFTIDSNANVAYAIGTTLTFVNDSSAGTITIAITSDTLVQAGTGSTGSRTLAANGVATALKVTSTRWVISGISLT